MVVYIRLFAVNVQFVLDSSAMENSNLEVCFFVTFSAILRLSLH